MQSELQRGFVLHRRPYSETSLLVDLFTEESGRLTVIAKGARKAFILEIGFATFHTFIVALDGKKHIENPH